MKSSVDRLKREAARAAVAEVEPGMRVGLGTGSTVAFAIEALAERVAAGLAITAVATSLATERAASAAGIAITSFETLAEVDLAIDGADEVDGALRAIKGAGGAMLREKVVAAAARRMIAIVDEGKRVDTLGKAPLPVEILPFAATFATQRIEALGARVTRRMAGAGAPGDPYRTDQGNGVLDCAFGPIADAQALSAALDAVPGVLGHGLFLDEIDAAFVGTPDGVRRIERDR